MFLVRLGPLGIQSAPKERRRRRARKRSSKNVFAEPAFFSALANRPSPYRAPKWEIWEIPGEKRHININFLLWLTSGWPWDKPLVVPGLTGLKKFMCSPRNTGNIKFSLWLTGGLSQGCPDFQKVYVFKVYVPFSCPRNTIFGTQKSGTKKEPKPKLLSPDIFWWVGGLPREGGGGRKVRYVPRNPGNQTFLAGYPGIWPGYPGSARKVWEKNVWVQFSSPKKGTFGGPLLEPFK